MIDSSFVQYVQMALEFLVIPIFGMVWGVQGRLSKMEGEIQALYRIIEMQHEQNLNRYRKEGN